MAVVGRTVAVVAVALILAWVVYLAQPARVLHLLLDSEPRAMTAAAGFAGLAAVLRGARLKLLLPPERLGSVDAVLVATAAQAAALFVPARLGEAAVPWLLRRTAGWDLAAGVSTLLAARALDLASLGAWAGAGVLVVWGVSQPAALAAAGCLLVAPFFLPGVVTSIDRLAVRGAAVHGLGFRRWARRVRHLRRTLGEIQRRPLRLAGAALASLSMWAATWVFTWLVLRAMGLAWSLETVTAGSAWASLANLLPVNLVANLGTLEAGWTAAFTALGVPVADAAASGLGAHVWALVFAAAFGGGGWVLLLLRPQRDPSSSST